MKAFEKWNFEEVEETFGIKRTKKLDALTNWISQKNEISKEIEKQLIDLRTQLQDNAEIWNEDELKFYFLGRFVSLINFDTDRFKSFLHRKVSAQFGDETLSGNVDFVVATGKQEPRNPFFFLHEYKQERKRENDPLGQVLIAMIAAQMRNNNNKPVLGCYVVGRLWFFLVLENKEYSVSLAYDATQEDIFQIYSILQQAKANINEYFDSLEK